MQRLKVSACCPSCGAPFELLEGANVARCSYCDLPLLFQSQKKILRYYLESKFKKRYIPFLVDRFRKERGLSLSRRVERIQLLYLPFWRFTAQAFFTIVEQLSFSAIPAEPDEEPPKEEVSTKDWDINFCAHNSNDLGIATLGMRPDWLSLKILTDRGRLDQHAEVLTLETNSQAAKQRALRALNFYLEKKKAPEDQLILRLIEERLSLIYFPLWVVNFIAPEGKFFHVVDGITKRTLNEGSGYFELKRHETADVERFYALEIVPHRCPDCGWDLPVTPFHVVFPCDNCKRIWRTHEGAYHQIRGEIAKVKEELEMGCSRSLQYYPFWLFERRLQGRKSSSIQDIFELLPSEIGLFSVKDRSRPFLFYVPAFEMKNLIKLPNLGLVFVRTQPDFETESVKREKLKGVFIAEDDAKKMAEILWLRLISQKANLDLDDRKNLKFVNGRIVWLPCYEEGAFLRDGLMGYSFQRVR